MKSNQPPRGFTLTELMVVVAIMGILATVAISFLRAHVMHARSVEAFTMGQSIRAAQERWRAENLTYLNVSSLAYLWYPRAPGGSLQTTFYPPIGGHPEDANWRLLNPTAPEPVEMGYVAHAGPPGQTPPGMAPVADLPGWSAVGDLHLPASPSQHWYSIQILADSDDDGEHGWYMVTSFSPEVFHYGRGE